MIKKVNKKETWERQGGAKAGANKRRCDRPWVSRGRPPGGTGPALLPCFTHRGFGGLEGRLRLLAT